MKSHPYRLTRLVAISPFGVRVLLETTRPFIQPYPVQVMSNGARCSRKWGGIRHQFGYWIGWMDGCLHLECYLCIFFQLRFAFPYFTFAFYWSDFWDPNGWMDGWMPISVRQTPAPSSSIDRANNYAHYSLRIATL